MAVEGRLLGIALAAGALPTCVTGCLGNEGGSCWRIIWSSAEGVGRVGGAGANGLAGEGDRMRGGGAAGVGSAAMRLGPVGKRASAKQTCGESKKR